ncbi:MAG: sigma-70 family RNA polymerase sigma factor [Bacillota bacterium]|nr:sigma-70 family RNA polymerase sigma factor [Bacillota bacterium]
MSDNEMILLEKAVNGDIQSFELLIRKYQKFAYNIALNYLKNIDEAEDATQEALIKAFKYLKNFHMESKFSTWLYRIVINTCKDQLRKKSKENNLISLNANDTYEAEIEDLSYEPLKTMENKELSSGLKEAINQLKIKYKEVIILCDVNDISYNEISDILKIPVGTVRSRINRGRKMLRKIINEMELFDTEDV